MGGDVAPGRRRRRRARGGAPLRSRRGARRPARPDRDASSRAIRTSTRRASASSTPPTSSTMEESPAAALRRKPSASIKVAAEIGGARRSGGAVQRRAHRRDGDGGATARSACCRASIGRRWPRRFRRERRPAVLLDVGASVECRPQHLLQFAVMGSVYARVAFGIESPRVGLLSIGEEETKGNELTREAHRLLKASPLHVHRQRRGARRLQRRWPT